MFFKSTKFLLHWFLIISLGIFFCFWFYIFLTGKSVSDSSFPETSVSLVQEICENDVIPEVVKSSESLSQESIFDFLYHWIFGSLFFLLLVSIYFFMLEPNPVIVPKVSVQAAINEEILLKIINQCNIENVVTSLNSLYEYFIVGENKQAWWDLLNENPKFAVGLKGYCNHIKTTYWFKFTAEDFNKLASLILAFEEFIENVPEFNDFNENIANFDD